MQRVGEGGQRVTTLHAPVYGRQSYAHKYTLLLAHLSYISAGIGTSAVQQREPSSMQ